jgi:purine-nucleoside phosphorylase
MPRHAMILGSGLGHLWSTRSTDPVRIPYGDLPGFPEGGVSGHAGEVVAGLIGKTPVIMLSGRAHYYEHARRTPCARRWKRCRGLASPT